MATLNVLDERLPHDDDPGAMVLLEPAHQPQPRFQPAVITFDSTGGLPFGAVPCRWQQLLQHRRVYRCLVGGDLAGRDLGRANRPLEEAAGRRRIPACGHEHVDNLVELIDRSVHVALLAGDLHI
jgi:hypothetical protein